MYLNYCYSIAISDFKQLIILTNLKVVYIKDFDWNINPLMIGKLFRALSLDSLENSLEIIN